MFITALLSLLGSSSVGSIIGGIFGVLNRKSDLDAKRMDLDHEQAKWANDLLMRNKDIELANAEAAGRKDVAIVEGDATVEAVRMQAIAASQAADVVTADEIRAAGAWSWLLVIASFLRTIIRPAVTIALTSSAIYLNWLLIDNLTVGWEGMTPDQKYESSMQAFAWITGQAASVIAYWFVVRGNTK